MLSLLTLPLDQIIPSLHECIHLSSQVQVVMCYYQEQEIFTYGWSMYTTQKCWSDAGRIEGRHRLDSTTVILAGLLAVLTVLQAIPDATHEFTIQLPTQSMVKSLLDASPIGVKHVIMSDYVLICSAKKQLVSLKDRHDIKLVTSNQSLGEQVDGLLKLAKNEAFRIASQCFEDPTRFATAIGMSPASRVIVERAGKVVAGNYRSMIREDLYLADLREVIQKTEKWPDDVFPLVAWEAFSKAFKAISCPKQVSYSKLAHKLLQTNSRNHRFYGTLILCPCCNVEDETLAHVFSCGYPEIAEARAEQLSIYQASLQDCCTPEIITETLIHGITTWCSVDQGVTCRQIPPPALESAFLVSAYRIQTSRIGWEAFLRGRVASAWGEAYKSIYPTATIVEVQRWLSDLVRTNLDFSLSLWRLRNGLVHGKDWEASRVQEKKRLQKSVSEVFAAYKVDPFIVSRKQSALFDSKTIHQRLQQDRDSLRCWLADVKEAISVQQADRQRAAEAAQRFFQPRRPKYQSPPSSVHSGNNSSGLESLSTRTYNSTIFTDSEDTLSTKTYDSESDNLDNDSWSRHSRRRLYVSSELAGRESSRK